MGQSVAQSGVIGVGVIGQMVIGLIIDVVEDGGPGFKRKKKKYRKPIYYSDTEAREAYLRELNPPLVVPSPVAPAPITVRQTHPDLDEVLGSNLMTMARAQNKMTMALLERQKQVRNEEEFMLMVIASL